MSEIVVRHGCNPGERATSTRKRDAQSAQPIQKWLLLRLISISSVQVAINHLPQGIVTGIFARQQRSIPTRSDNLGNRIFSEANAFPVRLLDRGVRKWKPSNSQAPAGSTVL